MPYLKGRTERVVLPSTKGSKDEAWVELSLDVPIGVVVDVQGKSEAEASLIGLAACIREWNLTDEKGVALPVTVEVLRQLSVPDFGALVSRLSLKPEPMPNAKKKS